MEKRENKTVLEDAGDSPKALYSGTIVIGEMKLPCAVIEGKVRVISEAALSATLGRGVGGKTRRLAQTNAFGKPLPSYVSGRTLDPFISPSLRAALMHPIAYRSRGGTRYGLEASLIAEICEVWLKARDAKALQPSQEHIAERANILVRGLAALGAVALVDEVTGYQAVRDRDELHKILEAYIAKELMPWAKRFPDEFYEELFRLKGWSYSPVLVKRPRIVGKLTNQIIYDKLPPGVVSELTKLNPRNEKGRLRHKHHQFLTDDVGHPHLQKQLVAVTTLMKISNSWAQFMRLFNKAFPSGEGTQIELDLEGVD